MLYILENKFPEAPSIENDSPSGLAIIQTLAGGLCSLYCLNCGQALVSK